MEIPTFSHKFDNISKETQKKSASVEAILPSGNINPDFMNINDFQVFENHILPKNINPQEISVKELMKYPLINDPLAGSGTIIHPFGVAPEVDKQTLMAYVKRTPEVVSVFTAIIEDIISDGFVLETDDDRSGRNRKLKAEKFLRDNKFTETIASLLWDWLGTGDGYLFKSKIGEDEVRKSISNIVNSSPIELKSDATSEIFFELKQDEDLFKTRKFDVIPASTVKIQYSKTGGAVEKYIQVVGTQKVEFTAEEVIHFRLWRVDGKIYGFTPLQSVTDEIDILANIKNYARYYFEKGGVPNWMYILKNETPDSNTYKQFKKALQEYASLSNRYKSLVLTGEVEAKELNKLNKDMEFRELAKYITQIIVMVWGVPTSRLSDVLIEKGVRGATIAVEGYYRKISHMQDILEETINSELLDEFKVKLKFNRSYRQDEVREVQIEKIMTDVVEQRISLGLWDRQEAAKYLKVSDEVVERMREKWKKMEEEEMMPQTSVRRGGSRQFNQEQLNQMQMLSETEDLAEAGDKQKIALSKKSTELPSIPNVLIPHKKKKYIIENLDDNKLKVEEI